MAPKPLTITLETKTVAVHPGGSVRTSLDSVGTVSLLAQSTSLTSSRRETAHFAVFVDGVADPVDARVVANLGVRGIHQDDFIVLLGGVLVDPVGVEDAQIGVPTANLLLSNALQVALELELVDTLMPGVVVGGGREVIVSSVSKEELQRG